MLRGTNLTINNIASVSDTTMIAVLPGILRNMRESLPENSEISTSHNFITHRELIETGLITH